MTTIKAVTNMIIKEEYPPNYLDIIQVFGDVSSKKPIFCYGDYIYNPFKIEVTPDLEIHEDKHRQQQGTAPDIWWEKYLTDDSFRLSQEIEAYGEQYLFACKMIDEIKGGGKMKKWVLESIAFSLSSSLYGNVISLQEAVSKIRNYGTR